MRTSWNEVECWWGCYDEVGGRGRLWPRWKLNPCVVDETQYRRIEQQQRQHWTTNKIRRWRQCKTMHSNATGSGGGRRNRMAMAMAQSKRVCASRLGGIWQMAGEESLNPNRGRIVDSKKCKDCYPSSVDVTLPNEENNRVGVDEM